MTLSGKERREKGKRGEREWVAVLREAGISARRGQQFHGGGDSPDVVADMPGFHCEVKLMRSVNPWEAMDQARREAKPGDIPYVAMRINNRPWLVTLQPQDFLRLTRAFLRHRAEVAPGDL